MIERATRNTRRKECIRHLLNSTYAGRPVILDELRWAVLGIEIDAGHYAGMTVTRSWLNSFARTIREQFSDYTIHKIPINGDTPVGLVARAAVYRLPRLTELRQFLAGDDSCILCRYKTDLDIYEPRYKMRYVTPQYHVATFRFFDRPPERVSYGEIGQVPGTLIPATQKVSVVVPLGVRLGVPSLAAVPWKLFGYHDLDSWYDVHPTSRLDNVHRNRLI